MMRSKAALAQRTKEDAAQVPGGGGGGRSHPARREVPSADRTPTAAQYTSALPTCCDFIRIRFSTAASISSASAGAGSQPRAASAPPSGSRASASSAPELMTSREPSVCHPRGAEAAEWIGRSSWRFRTPPRGPSLFARSGTFECGVRARCALERGPCAFGWRSESKASLASASPSGERA